MRPARPGGSIAPADDPGASERTIAELERRFRSTGLPLLLEGYPATGTSSPDRADPVVLPLVIGGQLGSAVVSGINVLLLSAIWLMVGFSVFSSCGVVARFF